MHSPQSSRQVQARGLIPRLDACIRLIGESETLVQSHAMVYAAFLSDLAENRLNPEAQPVIEMLGMVGEFCTLIETEYPTAH
jgi:hypothetical protein